jgi:hypothetical protein
MTVKTPPFSDLDATKLVEKASEALADFVSHDEARALGRLSPDFRLQDPSGLFAGDVRRFRRFLASIASDKSREYRLMPWSYAGSTLRFKVGFRAAGGVGRRAAPADVRISLWVHLDGDGFIRGLDLHYRPIVLIAALSGGTPARAFRLLLFRMGMLRLGSLPVIR